MASFCCKSITVANTCLPTIPTGGGSGGTSIFGSEYESIESLTPLSTTLFMSIVAGSLSGGFTKLNLITASKPIGKYRIDWSYDWTVNSGTRDLVVAVTVDGITTANIGAQTRTGVTSSTGGLDTDDFAIAGSENSQRHHHSGFFYQTFGTETIHVIQLIFGRGTTGVGSATVTLANVRLQIMRVE